MSSNLEFTGWFGELKTIIAKKIFLRSSDYIDINNVTIRTHRGTTQIDHVIISRYGVFVVETKNMNGWIFGTEDDSFWTKTNWGRKIRFQNPLHQNKNHITALSDLIKVPLENIYSIIVFRGNCTMKTEMPSNVLTGGFVGYIKSKKRIIFTENEVKHIVATIKAEMLPATRATHLKHVEYLTRRFESNTTCGRCGSPLVRRTVRSGSNEGRLFLGCSRYPSCRYTRNAD